MTVAERQCVDLMEHLQNARDALDQLASGNGDWAGKTLVDCRFNSLEEEVADYVRCHFNVRLSRSRERCGKPQRFAKRK